MRLLLICMATCVLSADARSGRYLSAPHYNPEWREWVRDAPNFLIRNMTLELLKDVQGKMAQAIQIKMRYQDSMTYQIGLVAGNIMDRFEKMLTTYRKYSNLSTIAVDRTTYNIPSYLAAYQVIQGDYHQIRIEHQSFHQSVAKLEKKQSDYKKKLQTLEDAIMAHGLNKTPSLREGEKAEAAPLAVKSKDFPREGGLSQQRINEKPLWSYKEPVN